MFKNEAEMWKALLGGAKVRKTTWAQGLYFVLDEEGELINQGGYKDSFIYTTYASEGKLYEEPKLILGPEHVGRRVKLRNGDIELITAYRFETRYPVRAADYQWYIDGQYSTVSIDIYDIVEILD